MLKNTEFFTDFTKGISGIVKSGTRYPRNTFSMRLKALVEADEFTGYYIEVTRELDRKQRYYRHSTKPNHYYWLPNTLAYCMLCLYFMLAIVDNLVAYISFL